jgi:adenine-specific DNA-methyltransferase
MLAAMAAKPRPTLPGMACERDLLALAVSLGAREVAGWSPAEEALTRDLPPAQADAADLARQRLAGGADPLGDAFCALRSPAERRARGAVYTPLAIVDAMVDWAARRASPARIVDAGSGSARFLAEAARRFPAAELLGIELDPRAALIGRANLAAAGFAARARIVVADYREATVPPIGGRTLYLGNPPYVRHHRIGERWKAWLARTAAHHGLRASGLAGLHAHFVLATADRARTGDYGAFVTAAEWLDVNYGRLIRALVLGRLGGLSLDVLEPAALPFPGTATTAAVTCFEIGARPAALRVRRVATGEPIGPLRGGRPVRRERLDAAGRWTPFLHATRRHGEEYVELGELCRVHRGQVTGANHVWIAGAHSPELPPATLYAAVTRARELVVPGGRLLDPAALRRVIDLPVELDRLEPADRRLVERFLRWARRLGAHRGYVARNRTAWWSVGLRPPAPILATYMARRPPSFARNLVHARHINIAHGLYPREPLSEAALTALTRFLATRVSVRDGRTYAGGLTKFEPREMERLPVPEPRRLSAPTASSG